MHDGRSSRRLRTMVLAAVVAVGAFSGCTGEWDEAAASLDDVAGLSPSHPPGWSVASHSGDTAADYETVFPRGEVLRLDLTIAPEAWQEMLADMTELYGPHGTSKHGMGHPPLHGGLGGHPEMKACDGAAVNDGCSYSDDGVEHQGLCARVWGDVMTCVAEVEDPTVRDDPMATVCEALGPGDSCIGTMLEAPVDGVCIGDSELTCTSTASVIACEDLEEHDVCAAEGPGGTMLGSCRSVGDVLVCKRSKGGGPPPGGHDPPPGGPGGPGSPSGHGGAPGGGHGKGKKISGREKNPVWVPCTVAFAGKEWWHVGIRFKGHSSLMMTWSKGSFKLPFKLDFDHFDGEHPETKGQKFYGFERLSFANNMHDDSFLREKVAGDLFLDSGVPTPHRVFVRVYLDVGEGSTYMGLYTMAEVPDEPLLVSAFGAAGGNLYKPDGPGARWEAGVTAGEDGFPKKTNEEDEDWSDIQGALDALHAPKDDPAAWRSGLEATFDVYGFLRWLAINTIIQDWDTYGAMAHNYYLYGNPAAGGQLSWIPWDHNESFKGSKGKRAPVALDMSNVTGSWPLIRLVMDDPVYNEAYWAEVVAFVEGPFSPEKIAARLEAEHDLVAPYVVGPLGEQEGFTSLSEPKKFLGSLDDLLEHMESRLAAVQEALGSRP